MDMIHCSLCWAWSLSHYDCSVKSWHYIGTTWMSTKCEHGWNCVQPTPVTLCWHFPLETDVFKHLIGRDCFHTHCCCREQHCDVTGWSRKVSISMFFECFILIFKQATNISIKWKCSPIPCNKNITHVLWLFSFVITKSKLLLECQRPNVIRLMTFENAWCNFPRWIELYSTYS